MKAISILRVTILFFIFCVALILFFGEEQDENIFHFCLHLVIDKLLASLLFFLFYILFRYWRKHDKAINWLYNLQNIGE